MCPHLGSHVLSNDCSPERKLGSKACRSLPPTKLWFMDVQLRNYWTFFQWIEYRAVYFQDTYTLLYAFTGSVTLVGVSILLTWLLWLWDIQLIQPKDILVLALMFLNFHLMKTWGFGDTGVIPLISYRRIQWECFILWKHRETSDIWDDIRTWFVPHLSPEIKETFEELQLLSSWYFQRKHTDSWVESHCTTGCIKKNNPNSKGYIL